MIKWFSRLVSRTCHRTFMALARIIKCKRKAMSTTKCETILQASQCDLFDVDWRDRYSSTCECNVIFNSDVYKGGKKNKSHAWWTTCENKKKHQKKTFRRLHDTVYAKREIIYLSWRYDRSIGLISDSRTRTTRRVRRR